MKAVPAQAAGAFSMHPAPPGLEGVFSCTWIHRLPRESVPSLVVTPDATIDLQLVEGALRIAGPDTAPMTERLAAGATVVGFRFRPAAASAWLGLPASELVGMRLPLETLWGRRARRLGAAPRCGADPVAALARALANERADDPAPGDPAMRAAFALLERGLPSGSVVTTLRRDLGLGERTLRRRFDESFGYGPKTLDRILRLQRFQRLARAERGASLAALAAAAGYADQSHLVRECRRLTGQTPSALLGLLTRDEPRGNRRSER
ncbi:helix-turn-helix domain-containing protein [Vulgatibacter sp.]|uniref:helix-turn-helix domain-containing protein n=1 Tax=Vulgatibacter sp. TaxID=1971226 RepID=UPI00356A75B8